MVSRAAWLYIGLVVLATAILVAETPWAKTTTPHPVLALITLQALFLACDSAKKPLTSRQTSWSPSSSASLAAVVLLGPLAAALVGATSLLSMRRQLRLGEHLFNGAMHALSGLAAGEVFLRLSDGRIGLPHPHDFAQLIVLPFAAAAAVHVVANHGLIWVVHRLNRGSGLLKAEALESSLPLLLASDLGYASLGLIVASLWVVM